MKKYRQTKFALFIKKYWKIALTICLAPGIVGIIMTLPITNIDNGSNDGWLGFWGGYLGSIIGVIGVFIQISRQREYEKRRIAESVYPKIRVGAGMISLGEVQPRVIQEYPHETTEKRNIRLKNFASLWREDDTRISGVSFFNASSNNFYDVIVQINYSDKDPIEADGGVSPRLSDSFIIPQLTNKNEDAIIFHIPILFPAYFDDTAKKEETLKVIKRITIWGTTEANEVLKFEFKNVQVYNFMPGILGSSPSIEREYQALMNKDIFPLLRVQKSLGEKEEKQQRELIVQETRQEFKNRDSKREDENSKKE